MMIPCNNATQVNPAAMLSGIRMRDGNTVSRSLCRNKYVHSRSVHQTSRRRRRFLVEDDNGHEGFIAEEDEETFWGLEENDAFSARKVLGRSLSFGKGTKSRSKKGGQKEHRRRQGLRGQRIRGSLRRGILGKRQRQERKYPFNGNNGPPAYDNDKGNDGRIKASPRHSPPLQRKQKNNPPSSRLLLTSHSLHE